MDGAHHQTLDGVSVVIPVKDDAILLRHCLRALAQQSLRPDEVVVVDNNSRDDSAAVARAAGAHVVTCGTPGIPAAAATGYDAAHGSLILRLDADCVPSSTWVETMVEAAKAHPDAAVFSGGAHFVDGPRPLRRSLAAAYLGAYAAVAGPALGHRPLFGSNLAFRASAWRDVRPDVHTQDPEIHDDLDLAFHFGRRHRIVHVRHAAMGVSMRPFRDPAGFLRRIHRGTRTVVTHWPEDFPPARWAQRVAQARVTAPPDPREEALV